MTKMDRRELKRTARETIRGTRPRPALVTLLYIAISVGAMLLTGLAVGFLVISGRRSAAAMFPILFLYVLAIIFSAVLSFGYQVYNLAVARRGESGFGDLLTGFSMVGRVLLMNLILFVFTYAWTLMVMIPAYIAIIFGSIAMAVPAAGIGGMAATDALTVGMTVLMVVVLLAVMLVLCYILMRYQMAPYLLLDHPEWGARQAIAESRRLMQGNAKDLYVLYLSFAGWFVLSVAPATAVVLLGFFLDPFMTNTVQLWAFYALSMLLLIPYYLWLSPYLEVTRAGFYLRLVAERTPPQPDLNAGRPEPF